MAIAYPKLLFETIYKDVIRFLPLAHPLYIAPCDSAWFQNAMIYRRSPTRIIILFCCTSAADHNYRFNALCFFPAFYVFKIEFSRRHVCEKINFTFNANGIKSVFFDKKKCAIDITLSLFCFLRSSSQWYQHR